MLRTVSRSRFSTPILASHDVLGSFEEAHTQRCRSRSSGQAALLSHAGSDGITTSKLGFLKTASLELGLAMPERALGGRNRVVVATSGKSLLAGVMARVSSSSAGKSEGNEDAFELNHDEV